jgi:hypothetical protein
MSLIDTILGLFPGVSTVKEDLVSLNDMRLQKYRGNWNAYYGINLDKMKAEDGTKAARVNFLKRNIDKINYFAFGGGYEMTHPRYQDNLRLANMCWGLKKVEKLLKLAQQGSVTGDAFIMVAPKAVASKALAAQAPVTEESKDKTPGAQISIVVLPSEYCLPYYDPFDSDVLIAMEVKVPFQVLNAEGKYETMSQYMKITDTDISYGILSSDGSVYGITPNERTLKLATVPNPIKSVYCVHVRNFPAGNSIYGSDDVTEAAALNNAYTERLTDIGAIVNYHSAPITCVYGAKAGSLVRGPNKVWGNLPKDGKVENLELKTDLRAANDHLAKLKEGLHELTGVPEIAQGSQQAISNTSGIALHTMYLPLIERADTKQSIYGPGLMEVVILTLKWCQELDLMSFIDPVEGTVEVVEPIEKPEEWEYLRQNTSIRYPSPLPKDRLIEAQIQTTLLTAKLQSRRQAMVALGVKDPDTLIEEIDDEAEEAAKHAQEMMATTGLDPSGKPLPTTTATGDAKGDESLDEGGSGVQSGAGATQGNQRTESGAQRGRPRT